jgi:hypothetical protein
LLTTSCGGPRRTLPRAPSAPTSVAVAAKIELEPLDLSPDGALRLLVRVRYRDARGAPVGIPPGGHVDVYASRGGVQWQPRSRFGGPAAIVRLTEPGPLAIRVTSDLPRVPRVLRATTDTRAWRLPAVTARPLGPHLVALGWFPRVGAGVVRVERIDGDGRRRPVARVAAPASGCWDVAVAPGAHYTYAIARPGADPIEVGVDLPGELPASGPDSLRGKAMWLTFDDAVANWDVGAMLARAQTAGLRAILVRLTYGETDEITPRRRPAIDRLIDGAAARGIAIIGWWAPLATERRPDTGSAAWRSISSAVRIFWPTRGRAAPTSRPTSRVCARRSGRASCSSRPSRIRTSSACRRGRSPTRQSRPRPTSCSR